MQNNDSNNNENCEDLETAEDALGDPLLLLSPTTTTTHAVTVTVTINTDMPTTTTVNTTNNNGRTQNIRRNLLSNIFFGLGSTFYLVLAVWDLFFDTLDASSDATSTDTSSDDDWDWYYIFELCGPSTFVANFMIDLVYWCRSTTGDEREYGITVFLFGVASIMDLLGTILGAYIEDDVTGTSWKILQFVDGNEILFTLAVHFYLVQAVGTIWLNIKDSTRDNSGTGVASAAAGDGDDFSRGMHTIPPNFSEDDNSIISLASQGSSPWNGKTVLFQVGDGLFLVGCTIDVAISYMDIDGMEETHRKRMLGWALVSASLWFGDAILYILADFIHLCSCSSPVLLPSYSPLSSSDVNRTILLDDGEENDGDGGAINPSSVGGKEMRNTST